MKLAKRMILAAIVLPITLGSAAVFAAGGGKGPSRDFGGDCGRGGMMNSEMFSQLNVTPEQKAKMAELRLKQRDAMHAQRSGKHSEMRALKQQERDLVMSSNFDEAAAKKLAEQMVQLRAEHRVAMMQHRNEMMNVLTADQKTKLASIQQDRMNECVLFGQGGPNGQGGKGGQGPRGQGMMRGGPQGQSMAPMMQ